MFKWLYKRIKDNYVIDQLNDCRKDIAQLRSEILVFETDVFDRLIGTSEKLQKRMQTRLSRDNIEDVEEKTIKRKHFMFGGRSGVV